MVEFRLLGPVEAVADGAPLALGGVRARSLLSMLLFSANHLVPLERIAAGVWEEPPRSAPSNLRGYVAALRRVLPQLDGGCRLVGRSGGYLIRVEPGELDLAVFERLAGEGRRALAAGDAVAANTSLAGALRLWRGDVCADLGLGPGADGVLTRLRELRSLVVEDSVEARIALGDHRELVGEIRQLLVRYPLRERLWCQLLTALHRSGRQGEALAAYGEARTVLRDELGLEPGEQLRAAHQLVLRGEPAAAGAPIDPVPLDRPGPICQLPPDNPDFTGYQVLTKEVAEALTAGSDRLPVVAVHGVAGAGKTALAVQVAHQVSAAFPDGQLYVHLGGGGPAPRDSAVLLAELLHSLGVAASALPETVQARAALYRQRLAGRRILVVLDDAAGTGQVRHLLPGTPGSAVLVTGRSRLAGLPGARLVELSTMDPADAQRLLTRLAGRDRVAAEPEAARRLLAQCGWLPLALQIVGARLSAWSDAPLASLADRLADERCRLDELVVADLDVRASISVSLRGLDPETHRAFRLLGLVRAPTFPAWVPAELLGQADPLTSRHAETLSEAQLLRVVSGDAACQPRYRMHDLVRLYATELVQADPPPHRLAALERLLAGWTLRARQAAAALPAACLLPDRAQTRLSGHIPTVLSGVPTESAAALDWFAAEAGGLVSAVEAAVEAGLVRQAGELAGLLEGGWQFHGLGEEWRRVRGLVRQAALDAGEHWTAARCDRSLGDMWVDRGRLAEASRHYLAARTALAELGDEHEAACCDFGLAFCELTRGEAGSAVGRATAALAVFRAAGDRHAEGLTLRILGVALDLAGEPVLAERTQAAALRLVRELGQPLNEATLRCSMALRENRHDRPAAALEHLLAARPTIQRAGQRTGLAYLEFAVGDTLRRLGRTCEAWEPLRRALAVFEQLGEERGTALTCLALGRLELTRDRPRPALRWLGRSRRLLATAGVRTVRAELTEAYAETLERLGRPAAAELARRLEG